MSTNESHKIDELFRDELSDYTVPVAVSTLSLTAMAVKKGLFYKLSLIKLNSITGIAIIGGTATTATVATVATVKLYKHYHKSTASESQHLVKQTDAKTAPAQLFVDTAQQMSQAISTENAATLNSEEITIVQTKTIENQASSAVHSINISANKNNTVVTTPTKIVSTQSNVASSSNYQTQTSIVTSPVQVQTTVADTVKPQSIKTVRQVVYVKPKPVVIQDTVVTVIKKVRPKK